MKKVNPGQFINFFKFKLAPPKLRELGRKFAPEASFSLLDVGCGNHSALSARKYFKNCRYYGLDRGVYNNDDKDFKEMAKFYEVDLSNNDLSVLADKFFDAIIISHVIEHLHNGLDVVKGLCRKLKEGGLIYIEFPSVRSLSLPKMKGTLHFCDDSSHIRIYDVKEISNVLLANNFKIIMAGMRQDKIRVLFTPLRFIYLKYIKKEPYAGAFCDLFGFADFVVAEKRKDK